MDGGAGNGHRIHDGGIHRRKATKKTKQSHKKKPIKIVYISNPMKVQTSAAEFMALVQELTGQDADFPDPSKFPSIATVCGGAAPNNTPSGDGDDDDDDYGNNNSPSSSLGAVELPAEDMYNNELLLDSFYDDFDDLIFPPPPPPMIGNFSGMLPAAAAIYESYGR